MKRASISKRIGAYVIDYMILNIISFIILFIITNIVDTSLSYALGLGFCLALSIIYYIFFTGSSYMGTPGKIISGIVVLDLNSQRISYLRSSGRWLGYSLSFLTLGIGFLVALFNKKKSCAE